MRSLTFAPLLYAATTLAANPRLIARQDDVCLHQEDFREVVIKGDSAKARDFWNSMGATQIVSDYLNSHGTKNWANDFLGSNYDCGNFPASNNCRSPDKGSCPGYSPKPKYYIQIAMSNLYNAFVRWHEALQDTAIQEITSGISEITDDWGPPKPNSDDIMSMILGASISVTGFTDEAVKLPIEASMSVFEAAISAAKKAAEQDPDALEGDLKTALGKCFALMKSQLETTVQSTFRADSALDLVTSIINPGLFGIELPVLDPKARVIGFMNDGVFLDSDIVNRAMDAWINSMTSLIHDGLVVKAWQTTNSEFGYKNIVLKKEKVSRFVHSNPCSHEYCYFRIEKLTMCSLSGTATTMRTGADPSRSTTSKKTAATASQPFIATTRLPAKLSTSSGTPIKSPKRSNQSGTQDTRSRTLSTVRMPAVETHRIQHQTLGLLHRITRRASSTSNQNSVEKCDERSSFRHSLCTSSVCIRA